MRKVWWLPALIAVLVLLGVIGEIAAFVWVLDFIGFWPTMLLVSASSFCGIWLTRREGLKAWQALSQTITSGLIPTGPLAEAALILLGGLLLTLPGFLSDIFGLLLLMPFTRPLVRSALGFIVGISVARSSKNPTIVQGEVISESEPSQAPSNIATGELSE